MDTGAFERPGFVALRGAVDTATAAACRELIWGSLARRGVRRDDPGRWPAHLSLTDLGGDAFGAAATAPALTAAYATGRAGDVFLCHPFIVPTATWPHRGTGPRMIAQPAVNAPDGFALDGSDPSPVARAIVAGLDLAAREAAADLAAGDPAVPERLR